MTLISIFIVIFAVNIRSPLARIFTFFIGALLVLGPSEITLQKISYFTLVAISSVISVFKIVGKRDYPNLKTLTNAMLEIGLWISIFITYLSVVSLVNGNSWHDTSRTLFPLVLTIMGLPIVLEGAIVIPRIIILRFIVFFGLVSSFFVWFLWSQRRGLYTFGFERLGFDSEWPAFFAIAIFIGLRFKILKYRILDFTCLVVISSLLFLTLTRTNIVILAFLLLLGTIFNRFRKRVFVYLTSLMFLFYLVIANNLFGLVSNNIFYSRIVRSFSLVVNGGFGTTGIGGEATLQLRDTQAQRALDLWDQDIYFGTGILPVGATFDTSYASLAQFGIVGLVVFIVFISRLSWCFYKFSSNNSSRTVTFLFLASLLLSTFMYNWPMNKSVWMTFPLVLMFVISEKRNSTNEAIKQIMQDKI